MSELRRLQFAIDALEQTHIRSAVIVTENSVPLGYTVPDFKLLDETPKVVRLSEIVPAVLIFYHGAWSLRCADTLRRYERELLPELSRRGVHLVGISPQLPDGSQYTRALNNLTFPLLSDVGNVIARTLGIAHFADPTTMDAVELAGYAVGNRNPQGDWELPHPTTLILDRARTVRFIDVRVDDLPPTHPKDILSELNS
ncbi:peroxiredoxin [Nocardia tenerifensis]|uniref:thioredoxin-dependent peroxiredoxin n=1 Tax=Nocardia tenerifensis TaxID=228006 RepID=A0A318JW38_9NOCA|nr:peroxiredoxin-like family protein [Nocardia tenerifensis]PXX60449.1 peroxiredoxin [Nocardia tenerifensis]